MATQVVSNNREQTQNDRHGRTEGPGPSYANAVLKLKPEAPLECQLTNTLTCPKASSSNEAMAVGDFTSEGDEGGSFTPVMSHHSRKERKNQERQQARRQQGKTVNGLAAPVEDRPLRREGAAGARPAPNAAVPSGEDSSEGPTVEKKVFVEAPLPKVNPWQTNRNAAQVVLAPPIAPPQPSVVRAPKDRKKYNAKVRVYYIILYFNI